MKDSTLNLVMASTNCSMADKGYGSFWAGFVEIDVVNAHLSVPIFLID